MFSFFLLFFSLLIILFPSKEDDDRDISNSIYTLIFASFALAQFFLGAISLFLISVNLAKFNIIFISLTVLIFTLITQKKSSKKILKIYNFINHEINLNIQKSRKDYFSKIVNFIILFFIILMVFSSIGPINHPDAAAYHVGYPFQFFKKGGFFIDGSYSQGLLGMADYANLSFIQENNIWLIRLVQIINLPILILFLSRKIENNIFLLTFITTPTFLLWSTIGKPLFLGESCLIAIYLIWKNNKTEYNFRLLIITIIACISFKISALIISFTIFFDIILQLNDDKFRKNYFKYFKNLITNKLFLTSFLVFFSLLVNRYIVTDNFLYPLLTGLFNSEDKLLKGFSELVRNYNRDGLFPINIFFVTSKSDLNSLGPAIFLVIISICFKYTKRFFTSTNDNLIFIGILQLILLILFAQGRADYYVAPLILFISQANIISDFLKRNKFRFIFLITLLFQSLFISLYLSISIFQNINLISSYEKNMNKLAYGYSESKIFNSNYPGRSLFTGRNTKLYFSMEYLERELMYKCLELDNINGFKNTQKFCLDKYNVNQIISAPYYLQENNDFKCQEIKLIYASRNPFNKNNVKKLYCVRKRLID